MKDTTKGSTSIFLRGRLQEGLVLNSPGGVVELLTRGAIAPNARNYQEEKGRKHPAHVHPTGKFVQKTAINGHWQSQKSSSLCPHFGYSITKSPLFFPQLHHSISNVPMLCQDFHQQLEQWLRKPSGPRCSALITCSALYHLHSASYHPLQRAPTCSNVLQRALTCSNVLQRAPMCSAMMVSRVDRGWLWLCGRERSNRANRTSPPDL